MLKRVLLVGSGNEGELGEACATAGVEAIRLLDADAEVDTIVAAAREHRVSGILANTPATLEAASRLGMPRLHVHDYYASFSHVASQLSVAGVHVAEARTASDMESLRQAAVGVEYPVWVKSCKMGRGPVVQVEEAEDLPLAFQKIRKHTPDAALCVQGLVHGDAYRVFGFKHGHYFHAVEVVSMQFAAGAWRVPMEFVVPCGLGGYEYTRVLDIARMAGRSLPRGNGAVEVDLVIRDDEIILIDVRETPQIDLALAAVLRAGLGVDVLADALRVAVGEVPRLVPSKEVGAALCWLHPHSGTVEKTEGLEGARALPGVVCIECPMQPGEHLGHIVSEEARDRLGYVLAVGPTRASALERAAKARDAVRVVTVRTKE